MPDLCQRVGDPRKLQVEVLRTQCRRQGQQPVDCSTREGAVGRQLSAPQSLPVLWRHDPGRARPRRPQRLRAADVSRLRAPRPKRPRCASRRVPPGAGRGASALYARGAARGGGYLATVGNAGSLSMSRGSCWMMTVALRFFSICFKRSSARREPEGELDLRAGDRHHSPGVPGLDAPDVRGAPAFDPARVGDSLQRWTPAQCIGSGGARPSA
jgi:hypothetical protein